MKKHSHIGRYLNGRWWLHPFKVPRYLWREVRDFVLRGIYGVAPSDTWELHSYLEDVLEDGLRQLAETTNGRPMSYATHEAWQEKLVSIADAIANYRRIDEDLPFLDNDPSKWTDAQHERQTKEEEKAADAMIAALRDMVKNDWFSLWD